MILVFDNIDQLLDEIRSDTSYIPALLVSRWATWKTSRVFQIYEGNQLRENMNKIEEDEFTRLGIIKIVSIRYKPSFYFELFHISFSW